MAREMPEALTVEPEGATEAFALQEAVRYRSVLTAVEALLMRSDLHPAAKCVMALDMAQIVLREGEAAAGG